VSAIDDPDLALILWMQQEEKLFKVLEKYLVEEKLKKGFGNDGVDVDDFINYSLSIHQRRKSRAGWAFDHHVAEVLRQNGVLFSRQSSTEGKNKPDYIFPSIQHYKDPAYLDGLLTMLALKTTAKDRWRQILPEANRIKVKNLLTLEPSISIDQTNEMKNASVKLVVPKEVKLSYTQDQQDEILDMRMFISEVLLKQNSV